MRIHNYGDSNGGTDYYNVYLNGSLLTEVVWASDTPGDDFFGSDHNPPKDTCVAYIFETDHRTGERVSAYDPGLSENGWSVVRCLGEIRIEDKETKSSISEDLTLIDERCKEEGGVSVVIREYTLAAMRSLNLKMAKEGAQVPDFYIEELGKAYANCYWYIKEVYQYSSDKIYIHLTLDGPSGYRKRAGSLVDVVVHVTNPYLTFTENGFSNTNASMLQNMVDGKIDIFVHSHDHPTLMESVVQDLVRFRWN